MPNWLQCVNKLRNFGHQSNEFLLSFEFSGVSKSFGILDYLLPSIIVNTI